MPFYVFTIGSALIVLGFTFKVIQVTSGLTDMKSPQAGKKFRNVGILSVITGLLIALVSLMDMVGNERNAMIAAGGNISALGISTLIQYRLNPQTRKALGWVASVVIIVGFILCIAYEMVILIRALQ